MSFDRFIARMNFRADQVPVEVNRVKRLAALAVDQTIVLATPVDTGRARSNWLVTTDAPSDQMISPYAPLAPGKDPFKIGEGQNANAAMDQGKQVIAQVLPGQSVCVTNNLPYIGRLNEGYSAQAPANFVEAAIDAGLKAVAGARIDTGKGTP